MERLSRWLSRCLAHWHWLVRWLSRRERAVDLVPAVTVMAILAVAERVRRSTQAADPLLPLPDSNPHSTDTPADAESRLVSVQLSCLIS